MRGSGIIAVVQTEECQARMGTYNERRFPFQRHIVGGRLVQEIIIFFDDKYSDLHEARDRFPDLIVTKATRISHRPLQLVFELAFLVRRQHLRCRSIQLRWLRCRSILCCHTRSRPNRSLCVVPATVPGTKASCFAHPLQVAAKPQQGVVEQPQGVGLRIPHITSVSSQTGKRAPSFPHTSLCDFVL